MALVVICRGSIVVGGGRETKLGAGKGRGGGCWGMMMLVKVLLVVVGGWR